MGTPRAFGSTADDGSEGVGGQTGSSFLPEGHRSFSIRLEVVDGDDVVYDRQERRPLGCQERSGLGSTLVTSLKSVVTRGLILVFHTWRVGCGYGTRFDDNVDLPETGPRSSWTWRGRDPEVKVRWFGCTRRLVVLGSTYLEPGSESTLRPGRVVPLGRGGVEKVDRRGGWTSFGWELGLSTSRGVYPGWSEVR